MHAFLHLLTAFIVGFSLWLQINAEESDYEVEEYDFDDYNSIASTVSLLNIATEDGSALDQRLPTQKGPTTLKQGAFSPVGNSGKKDLHDVLRQKEVIRRQNGIAKVFQWDELGSSDECTGNLQLRLLTAAERGDVRSMVCYWKYRHKLHLDSLYIHISYKTIHLVMRIKDFNM